MQSNGEVKYWPSGPYGGKASIVSLDPENKNAKSVTIPPSFEYNGYTYVTDSISPIAFANTNIETITINSNVKFYIDGRAFANCKKLKKLIINVPDISINPSAFEGTNRFEFDGTIVPKIIQNYASNLLKQWELPVGYNYGNSSTNLATKKQHLYKLGKLINKQFTKDVGINAPYILYNKKGSQRGFAMAFSELARVMGISKDDIFTAGDGVSVFWNYVRLGNNWYNVDIYMFNFDSNGDNNYNNLFKTNSEFVNHLKSNINHLFLNKNIHERPSTWYVYEARYGISSEQIQNKQNFDTFRKSLMYPGYRP